MQPRASQWPIIKLRSNRCRGLESVSPGNKLHLPADNVDQEERHFPSYNKVNDLHLRLWISAAPDGNLYDVSCQPGDRKTRSHGLTLGKRHINALDSLLIPGLKPERPRYLYRVSDKIQTKPQIPKLEDKTEHPRWRAKRLATTSRPRSGLFCLPVMIYRKHKNREHMSKVFSYLLRHLLWLGRSNQSKVICYTVPVSVPYNGILWPDTVLFIDINQYQEINVLVLVAGVRVILGRGVIGVCSICTPYWILLSILNIEDIRKCDNSTSCTFTWGSLFGNLRIWCFLYLYTLAGYTLTTALLICWGETSLFLTNL